MKCSRCSVELPADGRCVTCTAIGWQGADAGVASRLRSATLEERDAATDAVSRLSTAEAAGLLAGLENEPGSVQARALYAFAGAQLHRQRSRLEGERFSLRYEGPISGALGQLQLTTPVLFRLQLDGADVPVSIERERATPLELLDAICSAAKMTWRVGRYGAVSVSAGQLPAGPVAYDGPLKARIIDAEVERRTDFVSSHAKASIRITTCFEWPLNPMGVPSMLLRRVVAGRDVAGKVQSRVLDDGNVEFTSVLPELPPEARGLDSVEAEIMATFPSGYEDHAAVEPQPGQRFETDGFAVVIEEVKDDGYLIAVSSRGLTEGQLSQAMLSHAVSQVILGIDEHGQEAIAKVSSLVSVRSQSAVESKPELKLRLKFVRPGFSRPTQLRFRVTKGALLATHILRFDAFDLP